MKSRNVLFITSLFGLGIGVFFSLNAYAFWILTCDDKPSKLHTPFYMVSNSCSIPAGSGQAGAYVNALEQWKDVIGMKSMVYHYGYWPEDHCTVNLDDGWNDVALVDSWVIDGALGRTFVQYDCDQIVRINILIANWATQGFYNPDEAFATDPYNPNNTGYDAFLHEFGHAHGLLHSSRFSVMRPKPVPKAGGGPNVIHSQPMPDDAEGGRYLYPDQGSVGSNILASAQRLRTSPNSLVNTASWGTINACRGSEVSFRWTIANTGTGPITSDQRFYLANSPTAHHQVGITMGTWFNATVNPNSEVSPAVTLKIPCGTPQGLYWVYHEADAGNKVIEFNESDNVVHNAMTVNVLPCGCKFYPVPGSPPF